MDRSTYLVQLHLGRNRLLLWNYRERAIEAPSDAGWDWPDLSAPVSFLNPGTPATPPTLPNFLENTLIPYAFRSVGGVISPPAH
jgi:hypothetical protein